VDTGILANGVSSRLDWNEFMARQTKFLQVDFSRQNLLHSNAIPQRWRCSVLLVLLSRLLTATSLMCSREPGANMVPCPQVKEEHAQAAREEALPAGRPELCPTSRKLLEHIRGRSVVAAGQVSRFVSPAGTSA
jgi:hypothetical protein